MNNKVDIIIPAYNSHKTIDRTLLSIAMQDNVGDLFVYIVNDGSSEDYGSIVNKFSKFMNIKELKLRKNKGPGFARGYGFSHSKSDYVVFVDSDDILLNSNAINILLNVMNNEEADLVISNFREEVNDGYVVHEEDGVFMHGKMYRRKYLVDNNIEFNYSYANEDNGFNNLLLLHAPKVSYLHIETYVWKNNRDSITRRNDYEYNVKGLDGYIYNIEWALNKAILDNCDYFKIASLAYGCLIAVYFYYLLYKEDNLINKVKGIYDITCKFCLDENENDLIYNNQLDFFMNDGNRFILIRPFITFDEYIDKINS